MFYLDLLLVGDKGSGKAALLNSISMDIIHNLTRRKDIIFNSALIQSDDCVFSTNFFDPLCSGNKKLIRQKVEVTLLVASADHPKSARGVSLKWSSFINRYPLILVLTSAPPRNASFENMVVFEKPVTIEEWMEIGGKMGAFAALGVGSQVSCNPSTSSTFGPSSLQIHGGVSKLVNLIIEAALQAKRIERNCVIS